MKNAIEFSIQGGDAIKDLYNVIEGLKTLKRKNNDKGTDLYISTKLEDIKKGLSALVTLTEGY